MAAFISFFFSFSFSFILSNHIWHGIWGTLNDNKIEYKQGQRYRYTQLIHIQKKERKYIKQDTVSFCYGGQTNSYIFKINIQSFLRVLTLELDIISYLITLGLM